MILNDKHIQIIAALDDGNGEGPNFCFETPDAVERFMNEIANDPIYRNYRFSIGYDVDGKDSHEFSLIDEPVDRGISVSDKINMLCNIITEAKVSADCGDPFFPIVYLVIEGARGTEYLRYAELSEMNYDWWNEFLGDANDFLNSANVKDIGEFKVYVDIAPEDIWDGRYIVKSRKRIVLSEDAVRDLTYEDVEGMILASAHICAEGYYGLCDDMYWFANGEAEEHKARLFGDGYYHAVNFISTVDDAPTQTLQYVDFARCVVEEGDASILEAVDIPYSDKSTETDDMVKQIQNRLNGETLIFDSDSKFFAGMMRSANGVTDEKLVECGDFITVIADKEYVATSLLEDEVLPMADRIKVVIIYTDDARFAQDRLDKLASYIVFDMDDADRASKVNSFLDLK